MQTESPNVKLTVIDCPQFEREIGPNLTKYAIFDCKVDDTDEVIQVALTHAALAAKKVNVNLLSKMEGSVITATRSEDRNPATGTTVIRTGRERVNEILNGTLINPRTGRVSTLLTLNSSNSVVRVSGLYHETTMNLVTDTAAKVQILNDKEKKQAAHQERADRLKAEYAARVAAKGAETAAATPAAVKAELETNDEDAPF